MPHGTEQHLEHAEHAQHAAHDPFDRQVAVSMAIIAAALAGVTLLSHRGHNDILGLKTEANILHTQASDQWNYYQAKNIVNYDLKAFRALASFVAMADDPNCEKERAKALEEWTKSIKKYEGEGKSGGSHAKQGKPDKPRHESEGGSGDSHTKQAKAEKAPHEANGSSGDSHTKPGKPDKPQHEANGGAGDRHTKQGKPEKPEQKAAGGAGDGHGKEGKLAQLKHEAEKLVEEGKEKEHQSHLLHHCVNWIDIGHLGLELALVLCSVAVLTKLRSFWLSGIGVALIGAALAVFGVYGMMTMHH